MTFSRTTIDAVKASVTIFDVCDEAGVRYPARGVGGKVFCPFHEDLKTMSGYLYPDNNVLHCYATCSRQWDIIDFWAQHCDMWRDRDGERFLNKGAAISALIEKFNIDVEATVLDTLQTGGLTSIFTQDIPDREKLSVKSYYGLKLSTMLGEQTDEVRADLESRVMDYWDRFDLISTKVSGWKDNLTRWRKEFRAEVKNAVEPSDLEPLSE